MKPLPKPVALSDCRLWRPAGLNDAVEVVAAAPADRSFPLRLTHRLGICLKVGGMHEVVADGKRLVYPADAICIRAPGCVWSCTATGAVAFFSIDIGQSALPEVGRLSPMTFLPRENLPEFEFAFAHLTRAMSDLERQESLAALVVALGNWLSASALSETGSRTVVARAREFLLTRLTVSTSLDELAAHVQCNKFALIRRFRRELGVTPHQYLVASRIDKSRELLAHGERPRDVAGLLGFADTPHFTRSFKKSVGVTPYRYARQVRVASAVPQQLG